MAQEPASVASPELQEVNEEQQNVEEIKQEIAQVQREPTEEEKKTEIFEDGQMACIHKPVFRRYDLGNYITFEFGL